MSFKVIEIPIDLREKLNEKILLIKNRTLKKKPEILHLMTLCSDCNTVLGIKKDEEYDDDMRWVEWIDRHREDTGCDTNSCFTAQVPKILYG